MCRCARRKRSRCVIYTRSRRRRDYAVMETSKCAGSPCRKPGSPSTIDSSIKRPCASFRPRAGASAPTPTRGRPEHRDGPDRASPCGQPDALVYGFYLANAHTARRLPYTLGLYTMPEKNTDLLLDLGEVALDAALDGGIIRDIPILRTLYAIVTTAKSFPERIFAAKIRRFLTRVSTATEQERLSLIKQLEDADRRKN